MAYHYVTSSQPPTSVTHAVVCHFTRAEDTNLIIGKSTRLEAHKAEEGDLVPVFDVAVYGRLATINVLSAPSGVRVCTIIAAEHTNTLLRSLTRQTNCLLSLSVINSLS